MLMGRFIISHCQLIPSDRPELAAAHQTYAKESDGGGDGRQPSEEEEMWKEREQQGEMKKDGARKRERQGD